MLLNITDSGSLWIQKGIKIARKDSKNKKILKIEKKFLLLVAQAYRLPSS